MGRNPFAEGVRTLRTHRALPIDLSGAFAPTSGLAVLKTFFERALTVDPDLRFQTSGELEAALDAISRAPGFEKSG